MECQPILRRAERHGLARCTEEPSLIDGISQGQASASNRQINGARISPVALNSAGMQSIYFLSGLERPRRGFARLNLVLEISPSGINISCPVASPRSSNTHKEHFDYLVRFSLPISSRSHIRFDLFL